MKLQNYFSNIFPSILNYLSVILSQTVTLHHNFKIENHIFNVLNVFFSLDRQIFVHLKLKLQDISSFLV